LNSNLIKQLKPKFNVLLRDDKSFPILVTATHDYRRSKTAPRAQERKKGKLLMALAKRRCSQPDA